MGNLADHFGDNAELAAEDRTAITAFLVTHAAERAMSLAQLEETYIREILRRTGGNRSEAARLLGIHRKTLLEKRRRYGID